MTESIVRPAKMPYGRLKDNGFVGIEGEHAARALVVETKDDLSAFASVNLIIDDLDCGAMTKTTSGSTTTLSMTLTSSMIGRSGRKICQLIMVNSGNTVVQKSSQFEAYVGRANEINRSVDDGVTIIILSEAVTEMAREAAAAAAEEAVADVVEDCQAIADAASASADAAAQSASDAQTAAASIVVDATLDPTSTHAIQNKAVASEISSIKADLGDINNAVGDFVTKNELITGVVYINPNDFDIGNITISTNGWAYSNAQTRVRTKEGTTISLKKGDIIGLSDYANARAYIGWRRQDETYGAKAWLTSDYTVTEDGDYVILLSAIPEATVTSKQDLLSKLNITVVDNAKNDTIRRVEHLESLTSATRNLNTVSVGRYNGLNRQPVLADDKFYGMSQIVSCEPDTQYTATLYNVTPLVGIGVSASFYDTNGTYTTRYVRSGVTSISFTTPSDCRYICIWAYNGSGIVLTDESAIQLELGNVSTQYIEPYTALDYAVRQDLDRIVTDIDASADSVTKLLFNECIGRKPFVHHIGIAQVQNIVVPAQSLFDIQRAKRLGFKVMELNTLATSDGAYITDHGFSGKFGGQFYSTDGTDLTNVLVSSMSLADIKEKVRYNSIYEKYRVAPPTLEEALKECKRVGIVPLIQWKDGIKDIVDAIMGKDNYISAVYQSKRPTSFYGVVSSWLEIANPNEVVAKCNESSGAYIAVLNVSSNTYSSFTEADWHNMAKTVHSAGYLIGSAYTSPLLLPVLQRAGFDMFIANYNINNIDNGNICNLYGETDFTGFTTTGTVSNNVVTLATGQELKPTQELQTAFLGGGYLSIRFSGSIYLYMGAYLNNAYHFESDGTIPIEFTTLYENAIPTFRIVAKEDTTIYEIVFKSSVM